MITVILLLLAAIASVAVLSEVAARGRVHAVPAQELDNHIDVDERSTDWHSRSAQQARRRP